MAQKKMWAKVRQIEKEKLLIPQKTMDATVASLREGHQG